MARKNRRKKEEIAEDYCFICKDGGLLMVCEYKDCLKAYHPHCVGRDDSFVKTVDRWTCGWHSCFICQKNSKFQCFCCPNAVCGRCICDAEFACVRGKKGFCNHCLILAQLIEENIDVDFDGGKIDFKDRDTYEGLFKEYWEIIKEKEGLTSKHVHSADKLLKKNKNYRAGYDSNETCEGEEDEDDDQFDEESHLIVSDYEDLDDIVENKAVGKRKRSKGDKSAMKKKAKSKKKEFIGWGSRPLIEFLSSIGKDSTKELSQNDVTTIITDYCRENKLFDPEKKKRVLCDERLQSLLGRKSVIKNSIHNLLKAHFAVNLEQWEESEFGCSSEERDEGVLFPSKRQRKLSSDGISLKESTPIVTPVVQRSCFASIVVENIKLVYLKRSLVEELLKQPETFEGKLTGSFVRIKSDPNDYLQKNTHQLVQVKGIKRASTNGETLLQVSNRPKDVSICKLSDDDFSKEECEDLLQRVKDGLLRKPTVVEFEEKARTLHEDIIKHWIVRELILLQRRIDQANEKGWRRELSEYMDRKMLLQKPSEQSRLLHEVPEVIADVVEDELTFEDSSRKDKQGCLPELAPGTSELPCTDLKGKGTSCYPNGGKYPAAFVAPVKAVQFRVPIPEEKQQSEGSLYKKSTEQFHKFAPDVKGDDILQREQHYSRALHPEVLPQGSLTFTPELKQRRSKSLLLEELPQKSRTFALEGHCGVISPKISHEQTNEKKQNMSTVEFIELSDDDEQILNHAPRKQAIENTGCSIWYCVGPHGEKRGPFSMSVLKRWSDTNSPLNFKVWRKDQSEQDAVSLTEALSQNFPQN